MRGTARAAVPAGLCCACGRSFASVPRSREKVRLPFVQPRGGTLPRYGFPLCTDCGRAHSLHEGFQAVGGVAAALGVLAFLVYSAATSPSGVTLGRVLEALSFTILALGAGAMVGLGAARVAGLVLPAARRAVRVANAVDYQFESWRPGNEMEDYRTFFLFSNEAYARAFTQANAEILRAPRKRALVAGE